MDSKYTPSSFLWDLFCTGSILGIWPRFIEPKLICTTRLPLAIPTLPKGLDGFKILQISDLHFCSNLSNNFLERLVQKTRKLSPDLIVLTGDLLCYGELSEPEALKTFLNKFHAPYGCYVVLGNHDYTECVSINAAGEYDTVAAPSSSLSRGFRRLFTHTQATGVITERAKRVPPHTTLVSLIEQTPFKLLHNATETISVKNTKLNICGLGEYSAGRCHPGQAFLDYDRNYPGIVLLHNPDGAAHIREYPGEIILSGHTHGGQINLPWLWQKFTLMEDSRLKSGLIQNEQRPIYINRGIGSALPFRWFAPPEILLLTLVNSDEKPHKS